MNRILDASRGATYRVAFCCAASSVLVRVAFSRRTPLPMRATIMETCTGRTPHDISMGRVFRFLIPKATARRRTSPCFASARRETAGRWLFHGPEGDSRRCAALNQSAGSVRTSVMYIPATQRVRSVVVQERTARFIGTDFTFEDIGERVLDDFSYHLLRQCGNDGRAQDVQGGSDACGWVALAV